MKKLILSLSNTKFESRPRSFRVGQSIQHKRDMTRFVRWPKYILLQRQKRILMKRLKVPHAVNQFSKTVERDQASGLFKLLRKYSPESRVEKRARLLEQAKQKADGKQVADSKRPQVLKFGLNHITTLVENKQAKLVVIAHDVDPIELVVWLPQLCRKMDVPYCFVKNKERLGRLVHQKTATAVALVDVRKEDSGDLELFSKNFRAAYNDNKDRSMGGGILGIKAEHAQEKKRQAIEKEALKKANL